MHFDKALLIAAAATIALAFVLQSTLPQNFMIPWGWHWPIGSYWAHLPWVAFRICLGAGAILAVLALLKGSLRHS